MQVILLAAGESSRMRPLSNNTHKSMIKVLGKPLLEHTIDKLREKNLKDIILVVGKNNDIEAYFGDGKNFGVSITYVIQNEPKGAGNAILLAKGHITDDFLLLNAYHVEIDKFTDKLIEAKKDNKDGALLVKTRDDVSNYGVIGVKNGKVDGVVEKPQVGDEPSKLCIVGVYLLSSKFINTLQNTPDQHYQLETALDSYSKGHDVSFIEINEDTIVLKYPWDLLDIKNYLLAGLENKLSPTAEIASSAQLIGNVYVEDGVKIMENAVVKGPCYLGKNAFIGTNSILRDGVDIEKDAVVGANMEIKNTLLSEGSKTHSGFIGDSVIGKNCRIAAGFNSANVRLDRTTVKSIVKDIKVDTGLRDFGFVAGDNTRIGVKSSTMPGVIIGENVVVGSATTVMGNIKDNVKYYTKFQEVVTANEK